MPFSNITENGSALTIKDEGLSIATNTKSIDFAGAGVTGAAIGTAVTETIPGGAGSGDVVGPSSSTDNAVVRFDSTTGKLIQNALTTLDDNGRFATPNDVGGITFGGGVGNSTTLKTGSDGTFLFDTGASQSIKFKGGESLGATFWGYTDTSFNYVWKSDTLGNTTQSGAAIFGGALTLASSDGGALGSAAKMWSDLFVASGAVINFNNGDVTITHAADKITVAGGTLEVPDDAYAAGWNGSTAVPTKNAVYDKIETISAGTPSILRTLLLMGG